MVKNKQIILITKKILLSLLITSTIGIITLNQFSQQWQGISLNNHHDNFLLSNRGGTFNPPDNDKPKPGSVAGYS